MVIPQLGWGSPTTIGAITRFLKTEPAIQKLNFEFNGVKIWPAAYTDHVVNALSNREVLCAVVSNVEDGAAGAYNPEVDVFKVKYEFDIQKIEDQPLTIHELTHAFLDIRAIAGLATITCEAICYLAQATFLEVNGYDPKGNVTNILVTAQSIARNTIIPGRYKVSSGEVGALEAAVKANPLYAGKASELFLSNGFTRGTKANFNRATFTQVFKW